MTNAIESFEIKVTWHEAGEPYTTTIKDPHGPNMIRDLIASCDHHDLFGHMFEVWAKKGGERVSVTWKQIDAFRAAARK